MEFHFDSFIVFLSMSSYRYFAKSAVVSICHLKLLGPLSSFLTHTVRTSRRLHGSQCARKGAAHLKKALFAPPRSPLLRIVIVLPADKAFYIWNP